MAESGIARKSAQPRPAKTTFGAGARSMGRNFWGVPEELAQSSIGSELLTGDHAEPQLTFPGSKSCPNDDARDDVYTTLPRTGECIQACIPDNQLFLQAAEDRGLHVGSSCFSDGICEDYKFDRSVYKAGVTLFVYDCSKAVDMGRPYANWLMRTE